MSRGLTRNRSQFASKWRLLEYDAACQALADAKSVDEVKHIIDVGAAMKLYARETKDGTVGSRCIVAWRNRDGAVKGGGGHQFYTAGQRERWSTMLPSISHGKDVSALLEVMMPDLDQVLSNMLEGKPAIEDIEEVNRQLARLLTEPDEQLK